MHHYKAPHDYFDNAARYESYLADVAIPEPTTLWQRNPYFGSLATRGANDELIPHIGTSIGSRNPRRSYLRDLPDMYPAEFPPNYNPADFSDEENSRLAYNAYLKKFLRCVRGIDDNLDGSSHLGGNRPARQYGHHLPGDQGFMLGEHDYQDKRWMYEESQRMPFLVRYPPTIPAGQRLDALVENVDFAPTMLDFAAAEIPASGSGSFLPRDPGSRSGTGRLEAGGLLSLLDAHGASRQSQPTSGIRTKTHKLIYYYGCNYDGGYQTPPGWELYDLHVDPAETRNLYGDPAPPGTGPAVKESLG